MLYRDEEEDPTASRFTARNLVASTLAQNLNSVLFDRRSPTHSRDNLKHDYEPDTVWRNLQRRERVLQRELQQLLDAQSAAHAANLEPGGPQPPAPSSSARSVVSDAESNNTTTAGAFRVRPQPASRSPSSRQHVSFEQPARSTPTGEVIPVRQPRKKPLGLRAARAGLAKNISLLADLKAEEDASLAAALSTRKKALAQLRRLSAQREGITDELRTLEADGEEPLTRELRDLTEERQHVSAEIGELEERLVSLRNRKRWLDGRIQDVTNRREAGLSGYKGALKEVEGRVDGLLRRPPVKPLDVEIIAGRSHGSEGELGQESSDLAEVEQAPGGAEFMRMRPERRTLEMAKEWWESEVAILERRQAEVDKERAALEEGLEVWGEAVKLVSDFEAGLQKAMRGLAEDANTPSSPDQVMRAQLDKMAAVYTGLEERLHLAEEKGWNLLICAIGAELEAFKQAEEMLRSTLSPEGSPKREDDSDDDSRGSRSSPPLAKVSLSTTLKGSQVFKPPGGSNNQQLVDLHEHDQRGKALESDNEVPADLLVSHRPDQDIDDSRRGIGLKREDSMSSENEVPPEFLAEHH